MMFQYSHTEHVDDAFSIHMLEIQMVIFQFSHTKDVDDDGLDADVLKKPLSRVKFVHFQDKLGVVRKYLPQKGE